MTITDTARATTSSARPAAWEDAAALSAQIADMEELQAMFQDSDAEIGGRLRVDMPAGVARNIVIPRLPEFLRLHPRMEMEISSTDRRVDPVSEGFDCVIRVGALHDSTLIARPLGYFRMLNCASADYLARHGIPKTLEDLNRHRLIRYSPSLGSKPSGFEYMDGDAYRNVEMAGTVTVNNSDAYHAACLAGLGIIQAPEIGLRDAMAQGKLAAILEEYSAAPLPVSLIYANRRHLPKRSQKFMEWIAAIMKEVVS